MDFHVALPASSLGTVLRVRPLFFRSCPTVGLHASFCCPLFLLPLGVHCCVVLRKEMDGIRQTCQSHRQRLTWIVSSMVPIPVLFHRSSLEIASDQKILRIRLKHLFGRPKAFAQWCRQCSSTLIDIGGRRGNCC